MCGVIFLKSYRSMRNRKVSKDCDIELKFKDSYHAKSSHLLHLYAFECLFNIPDEYCKFPNVKNDTINSSCTIIATGSKKSCAIITINFTSVPSFFLSNGYELASVIKSIIRIMYNVIFVTSTAIE